MAASVTNFLQSYDQATANDYSFAPGVHTIDPVNSFFQRSLPKIQASAVQHEWIEDELLPYESTLGATIATTDTATITVASGLGTTDFADVANVDTYIMIDREVMIATGRSTDKLTVTRAAQSTTGATHASGATMRIFWQSSLEGAAASEAVAKKRTRPSNYIQTFRRTIEISGPQEAVRHLGGVESEMDYQIMQRMRELSNELEMSIILGGAAAAGTKSSTHRTMAGLDGMITTNVNDHASAALAISDIQTDFATLWTAGGVPSVIVTSGILAQKISNLYGDRIRVEVFEPFGGTRVTMIIDPLNPEGGTAIIAHRMLHNEYFMLDWRKIALGYLRPYFMKDLADDGDADKRLLLGDYTLQLMNEKAHVHRHTISES